MKRAPKWTYLLLSASLLLLAAAIVVEIVLQRPYSPKSGPSASTQPSSSQQQTPSPSEPEPSTSAPTEAPTETENPTEPEPREEDWSLALVNASHPIDEAAIPEDLTTLRNDIQVDSRVYPALQKMFDDARAEGIDPVVNEGFRTRQRQQEILDDYTASYIEQGYGEQAARELALQTVALPGTSEHELGLALDIIASDDGGNSNEEVYQWLAENAYRYGFILRYPEDKVNQTGISFEPWHYRYVGKNHAEKIYQSGLCLEEYLDTL